MQFISGLRNCHLPGLYSLVLSERVSPEVGMRRVFYLDPNAHMQLMDGSDYRLKPHNHRQDISLAVLRGEVQNIRFVATERRWASQSGWDYRFGSALLNGQFHLERSGESNMYADVRFLSKCCPDVMGWNQMHTICASPGAAWLVEELDVAPPHAEQRCFSLNPQLKLHSDGLYLPLSEAELGSFSEMFTTA